MVAKTKPDLGITETQVKSMQKRISTLETENDAISLTPVRHAVGKRLVEIRLLLRGGNLKELK